MNSEEYLELKQDIESLKISLKSLEMELGLMVKKLKIKYKITHKDREEEQEDIKSSVLLPDV